MQMKYVEIHLKIINSNFMKISKRILFVINWIDELFGWIFSKKVFQYTFIGISLILFYFLLVGTTPFNRILREDAYGIVNKAMEFKIGDFDILHSKSIGWPLFLGFVFYLLNIDDIFSAMLAMRFVSITCIVFSIIPIFWICKKLTKGYNLGTATAIVILAFSSNSLIFYAARNSTSEPLFLILALICGGFLITDKMTKKKIVLSSIVASLAYYVRPNGLFLMGIILFSVFIKHVRLKKIKMIDFGIVLIVFFAVSAPHLVARWVNFGSPFDYGPNSKYFVDDYAHVWAPNIKSPSLLEYLKTHSNMEIHNKFVKNGIMAVWRDFTNNIVQKLWIYILFFSFLSYLFFFSKSQRYDLIFIFFLVSLCGLSMIYDVFGTRRHLVYLIPWIYLAAASWCVTIDMNLPVKFSNILALVLTIMTIISYPEFPTHGFKHLKKPEVKDEWAIWAAQHVKGKVAIVEGGDVLEMSENYGFKNGNRYAIDFKNLEKKISTYRPGIHNNLKNAMAEFKDNNTKYIITDRYHIKRRPYLKEIADKQWEPIFKKINHFGFPKRGGVLIDVNIYEIDWQKWHQYFCPKRS